MTALKEKRLDQLREQYRQGKLTPREFIEKAFAFKDGDSTRKQIMKNASKHMSNSQVGHVPRQARRHAGLVASFERLVWSPLAERLTGFFFC